MGRYPTNENTGDVRTLASNERGEFSFRAITPGSFKNVSFGGSKAAQIRVEIYNLFN